MNMPVRPRRLRRTPAIRKMVRETRLFIENLIYPLFVVPGHQVKQEISSLPGVYHLSPDMALLAAVEAYALGIPAVEIFGLPDSKDEQGSGAWDAQSPVCQTVRLLKKELPHLVVVTDVCLCQYTSSGHCGIVEDGQVLNDPTLPLLGRTAVVHAAAGADIVAPSDMMDGRVKVIREELDGNGFTDIAIMSYAAKYASAYYGPFRDAARNKPQFGDRKSYQMDPANRREAMKEVALDVEEGADMLIVKPALSYMDILRETRDCFDLPIAAYNVSGEYAMVKAAAANGWIDERRLVLETLLSMRRAGADMIITYHAVEAARWLLEGADE